MTRRNLVLILLMGVFCFGGTFTCSTDDDDDPPPPPPPPVLNPV